MPSELGNLDAPDVAALLREHLDDMYATSPQSVHALSDEGLRHPDVTFVTARRRRRPARLRRDQAAR